ncbi:MAG: hypothetical protein ACLFUP_02305 [Desulfobacteraceae bacterium]
MPREGTFMLYRVEEVYVLIALYIHGRQLVCYDLPPEEHSEAS